MSKENVGKFYQSVAADDSLKAKISELFKPYQGQAMDEAKKAALIEELVLPIAAEKGLSFSMEDLRQYEKDMVKANANHELDENELEAVAGGIVGAEFCLIIGAAAGVGLGGCWIGGIFFG